ncbi:NAD(P)/FAD-dependent oxidoreductase [Heliobacterium chlorum]|uniref:NAD(P)/FAD-dependent oxidoreductase n=1 Tax=Heliobacterium chlorum TaxID=2698 RepID=UPI001FABCAB9|nr:FAD-dependent oxidoreductase [Heliobacterium chlorum]
MDRDALVRNVHIHQSLGIPVQLLDPQQVKEMVPQINVDDVVVAAYEPESGYGDPVLTTNAVADAARLLGVEFRLQTEVTGILQKSDGSVRGVVTASGEKIMLPIVIDTAGAWAGKVAALAGKEIPIRPTREQKHGRPIALWPYPASETARLWPK